MVFQNPQLALTSKALLFAAFFVLARLGNFSLWSLVLFVLAALFLYARPFFRTVEMAGTLVALLIIAAFFGLTFRDPFDFYFAAVYFPFLFYLVLGIKDLVLIQRDAWRSFLNFALAYPAFLMFFYYSGGGFWWRLPLLFIILLFLSKDFLKKRLAFWLSAFLSIQVAWAADLLPIGFVSGANLALLFYAIVVSFMDSYLRGTFNKKFFLALVSVFVLLLVTILALSRWGI
ncbi:MAG: hypothetical protein Q8L24_00450 [bacterium]|nr:hypothetical protein [bacterium]